MKFILPFLSFLFLAQAFAEECISMRKSTNHESSSVNIVIVPSNFSGNMNLFRLEANKVLQTFERYRPFQKDNPFLNVSLTTKESFENNFCHFGCAGIDRLLCCDKIQAKNLASSCFLESEGRQVIVLHNDKKYGGAGYIQDNIATTSTNVNAAKVAVHELGHSLFNLADEYISEVPVPGNKNCEERGCSSWADLINLGITGAECAPNGCAGGNSYTCGQTVMKTLHLPFGPNNERLSCCTYKNLTGGLPPYCERYRNLGVGLESFCRQNELTKGEHEFGEEFVEYFDSEDHRSGYYKVED